MITTRATTGLSRKAKRRKPRTAGKIAARRLERSDRLRRTRDPKPRGTRKVGAVLRRLARLAAKFVRAITTAARKRLADDRGLPLNAFTFVELGVDGAVFTLTYRDFKGRIIGIRRWRLGGTPMWERGSVAGLFGANLLATSANVPVYLCEGEWDAIAMHWLLKTCRRPGAVVAVPGSTIFKQEWAELFRGRVVHTLYDKDAAGEAGELLAERHLTGIATTITFVRWPAHLKSGYDTREWVIERAIDEGDPEKCFNDLAALFQFTPSRRASLPPEAAAILNQRNFNRTDSGNAEYFVRRHGDNLRWHRDFKCWVVWTPVGWMFDKGGQALQLATEAMRERYHRAVLIANEAERKEESKWAMGSESRKRLMDLLELAKQRPGITVDSTHWNTDPWLLGTKNGVVDLRSGTLRTPKREDFVTLACPVVYDTHAKCRRWKKFLRQVFRQHPELIPWLQRAIGYSLTGETIEQVLFLLHGLGANGKSTFLNVVLHIVGPYGHNMPFSTFELKQRTSIPNDLAALVGKRFVISSETNEGTRFNEARIKAVTGGDPVTARVLYGEFFTYQPVAKFWLGVNHKPSVGDDSLGFWRRIRLVPFLESFKGSAADLRLTETLLAEAPGILAWAVRGCLAWQKEGRLHTPAVVRHATRAYEEESDPLREFLVSACDLAADAVTTAGALYRAYEQWANKNGIGDRELLSAQSFGRRMSERFEKTTTHDKQNLKAYRGIRLRGGKTDKPTSGLARMVKLIRRRSAR